MEMSGERITKRVYVSEVKGTRGSVGETEDEMEGLSEKCFE